MRTTRDVVRIKGKPHWRVVSLEGKVPPHARRIEAQPTSRTKRQGDVVLCIFSLHLSL